MLSRVVRFGGTRRLACGAIIVPFIPIHNSREKVRQIFNDQFPSWDPTGTA